MFRNDKKIKLKKKESHTLKTNSTIKHNVQWKNSYFDTENEQTLILK